MAEELAYKRPQTLLFDNARVRFPRENQLLLPFMRKIVKFAMHSAPLVRMEQNNEIETTDVQIGDNTIVFKASEDHHFLPLFEKVMFEELTDYHNSNGPSHLVNPLTFMMFDSAYPIMERNVGKETSVRGETFFEHELQHLLRARAEGMNIEYIIISFFRKETKKGSVLYIEGDCDPLTIRPPSYPTQTSISLAPRYPSSLDYEQVRIMLWSTMVRNPELAAVIEQVEEESGKHLTWLHGHALSAEQAAKILLKDWTEMRKNDIKYMNELKISLWQKRLRRFFRRDF